MVIKFYPYFLKFKSPFGISKLTRVGTESIIVTLSQNNTIGYGEAVFPPYIKNNPEEIIALLKQVNLPDFRAFSLNEIDDLLSTLPASIEKTPTLYAAIDIALHDLLGKINETSISQLYNIKSTNSFPLSSYTIGMSDKNDLKIKIQNSKNFNLLKIKLGNEKTDIDTLNDVQKLSGLPIAVDINQGWENVNEKVIKFLENNNCQYIEEPFSDNKKLKDLKTDIPIIADESFQNLESFKLLPKEFSGVNIKLMKCGGLREAYKIIKMAKEKNLKILLGCMSGSSCAIGALSHFSPLANWIDLDGPELIKNDPFKGLVYHKGSIKIDSKNGIGIEAKLEF